MIRRSIIFSVLYPQFDAAAKNFKLRPTRYRLERLHTVATAMECTQRRPLRVLTKMLKDVPPAQYVQVICRYKG